MIPLYSRVKRSCMLKYKDEKKSGFGPVQLYLCKMKSDLTVRSELKVARLVR